MNGDETSRIWGAISQLRTRIAELEKGSKQESLSFERPPKPKQCRALVDVAINRVRGSTRYRPSIVGVLDVSGGALTRRVEYFLKRAAKPSIYAIWQPLYDREDLLPLDGAGRYILTCMMIGHGGKRSVHDGTPIQTFDLDTIEWARVGDLNSDKPASLGG